MGPGKFLIDWGEFWLFRSIPSIGCRAPSVDSGVSTPPSRFVSSFRTFGRTLRDRIFASGGWLRQNHLLSENFGDRRRAPTTSSRLSEPPARFRLEIRTFGRDPSGMVLGDFRVFLGFWGIFGILSSARLAPLNFLFEKSASSRDFSTSGAATPSPPTSRAPFLI